MGTKVTGCDFDFRSPPSVLENRYGKPLVKLVRIALSEMAAASTVKIEASRSA
jgi:hypothetical protein